MKSPAGLNFLNVFFKYNERSFIGTWQGRDSCRSTCMRRRAGAWRARAGGGRAARRRAARAPPRSATPTAPAPAPPPGCCSRCAHLREQTEYDEYVIAEVDTYRFLSLLGWIFVQ